MAPLLIAPKPAARLRAVKSGRPASPVVWLNLVCLDAPIVALSWLWLFARTFQVSLSNATCAALFLTAWLIYLADRLADCWRLRKSQPRSLRQQFCQRHQVAWFFAIGLLATIDLWIILHELNRATIRLGAWLGAIAVLYLSINYWLGKLWRVLPIKELSVGLLFATGTAAGIIPQLDSLGRFAVPFVLFAALCSLNCISIAIWERELDRAQGKDSIATRSNHLRPVVRGSIALLAVAGIIAGTFSRQPLYFCIAGSAVLLGALDWLGETIPRDERTALADLVLLTPLLLALAHA